MKTGYFVLLLLGVLLGAVFLSRRGADTVSSVQTSGSNVTVENGTQIVTITAQGGFEPATSVLQSGIPTTIRFVTNGTYDCSSTVRIPSLGVSKTLPANGSTEVSVGSLDAGTIQGTCGMGMYRFVLQVNEF